jgi:hypothetical protein
MGELQGRLFPLDFNRSVRIEARPERLTADAGVLLMRELSDRLGLAALVRRHLGDPRDPGRVIHPFLEVFRTRVFAMVHGWLDQNDVGRLHDDPVFRLAVSERRGESPLREPKGSAPDGLCSQPTLSRFMGVLGSAANRTGLGVVVRQIARPFIRPRSEVTLDLDSLPYEVHGRQPGSAYNGHYRIRCYHPLVASVAGRWFLGARLRAGNAHTADGGLDFVLPIIRWLRSFVKRVWLRIDAGFPEAKFLQALEEEGVPYVCRLRSNAVLNRLAEPFLHRPPGRPPAEGRTWLHELSYKAGRWNKERRLVLVVVERPDEQQHLFLDYFFLLTSATLAEESAEDLLARYRQRGSAEADFGDCNTALSPALSSASRPKSHYAGRILREPVEFHDAFAVNEAELLLTLLAANLMAAGAQLLHVDGQARMSRERFRAFLLKTPSRVILGSRRVTVVIPTASAELWNRFWRRLRAQLPRGSPGLEALPAHA